MSRKDFIELANAVGGIGRDLDDESYSIVLGGISKALSGGTFNKSRFVDWADEVRVGSRDLDGVKR
jgi:hypothetical protein